MVCESLRSFFWGVCVCVGEAGGGGADTGSGRGGIFVNGGAKITPGEWIKFSFPTLQWYYHNIEYLSPQIRIFNFL